MGRPGRRNRYWRNGTNETSSDVEDGQISSDDEEDIPRRRRRHRALPQRVSKSKIRPPPNPPPMPLENVSDSSNDSIIILPTPPKPEPTILTISDEEQDKEAKDSGTESNNAGDVGDDLNILKLRRNVLEVMLTKENTKGTEHAAVLDEDNYEESVMDVSPADGQQLTLLSEAARNHVPEAYQDKILQDTADPMIDSNPSVVAGLPTSTWRQRRMSESSEYSMSEAASIPLPPEPPMEPEIPSIYRSSLPNPEPFRLRNTLFKPALIHPYDADERQNTPFHTLFGPPLPSPAPFIGSTFGPPFTPGPNPQDYDQGGVKQGTILSNSFQSFPAAFGLFPNSGNGDIDMRQGSGMAAPVRSTTPVSSNSSTLNEFSFSLPLRPLSVLRAPGVDEPRFEPSFEAVSTPSPPLSPPITFNFQTQCIIRPHPLFSPISTPSPPASLHAGLPPSKLPVTNQEENRENEGGHKIDEIPRVTVPSSRPKQPPKPPAIRLTKLGTTAFSPQSSPEERTSSPNVDSRDSRGGKRPLAEPAKIVERGREKERKICRTDTASPTRHSRHPKTSKALRRSKSRSRRPRSRSRTRASRRRYSHTSRGSNLSHHKLPIERSSSSRKSTPTITEVEKGSREGIPNSLGAVKPVALSSVSKNVSPRVVKANPPQLPPVPVNPPKSPSISESTTPEPARVTFTPSPAMHLEDEDQLRAQLLIDVSKTRLGLSPSSTKEPPNIVVKITQPNRNESSSGGGNYPTRSVYQSLRPPTLATLNAFQLRPPVTFTNNQRFPPFTKTIYNHSAFQTRVSVPEQRLVRYQNHFNVVSKPIRPIIINVRGGETSSDESDAPGGVSRTVTFVGKKSSSNGSPRPTTSRSVQVRNKESQRKMKTTPTKRHPTDGTTKPATNSFPIPGNVAASFDQFIADARRAAIAKRNHLNASQGTSPDQFKDLIPPVVKHLSLAAQAEYTELVGRIQQKTAKQRPSASTIPTTSPQKGRQATPGRLNSAMSPVHPRVRAIKQSLPSPIQSGEFSGEKSFLSESRTPSPTKRSECYDTSASGAPPATNRNFDDSFGSDDIYRNLDNGDVRVSNQVEQHPSSPLNSGINLNSSMMSKDSDCLVIDEAVDTLNVSFTSQDNDRLVIDETEIAHARDEDSEGIAIPSSPTNEKQELDLHSSFVSQDSIHLVIEEPAPARTPYWSDNTWSPSRIRDFATASVTGGEDELGELTTDQGTHGNDNQDGNGTLDSSLLNQDSGRNSNDFDKPVEAPGQNWTVIPGSPEQRRDIDRAEGWTVITGSPEPSREMNSAYDRLMLIYDATNDDDNNVNGILDTRNSKNDFDGSFAGEDDDNNLSVDESEVHLNVSKIISPPLSDGELDAILSGVSRTMSQSNLDGVEEILESPPCECDRENVGHAFNYLPRYDPGKKENVEENNGAGSPFGIENNEEEQTRELPENEQHHEMMINRRSPPVPTIIPFAAVNVLFPSVETSAQEQKHKELLLRERLLKSTLRRRVENSELQVNLRNAEGELVDKRLQCISKLDGLNEKLKKLSSVKMRQTKLQEDRHFYLRQLLKVERELEGTEKKSEKLETVVRARASSLLVDQAQYVHLTESCIEFGGKLSGIRYLLPKTSLKDYERKYAEVRKILTKVKISINLPDNPHIPESPPALPPSTPTATATSGTMVLQRFLPPALLPTQRMRHTPFTFHSYVENNSDESEEEAGVDDGTHHQLPSGRFRGCLTGNGKGTSDSTFEPYASPVTGKIYGESQLGAHPPPIPTFSSGEPSALFMASLTPERASVVPTVPLTPDRSVVAVVAMDPLVIVPINPAVPEATIVSAPPLTPNDGSPVSRLPNPETNVGEAVTEEQSLEIKEEVQEEEIPEFCSCEVYTGRCGCRSMYEFPHFSPEMDNEVSRVQDWRELN